jgi:hypothetical protein
MHPASLRNLERRPSFPPGNQAGLRHGGYRDIAERELDGKAREIFEALASDAPLHENGTLPRADAVAVALLADCLVRLEGLRAFHAAHGLLKDNGDPRPSAALEGQLREEAMRACDRLGMTPASRAKLGVDLVHAESAFERYLRERGDGDHAA